MKTQLCFFGYRKRHMLISWIYRKNLLQHKWKRFFFALIHPSPVSAGLQRRGELTGSLREHLFAVGPGWKKHLPARLICPDISTHPTIIQSLMEKQSGKPWFLTLKTLRIDPWWEGILWYPKERCKGLITQNRVYRYQNWRAPWFRPVGQDCGCFNSAIDTSLFELLLGHVTRIEALVSKISPYRERFCCNSTDRTSNLVEPYGILLVFPVNTGTYKATISIDKLIHLELLPLLIAMVFGPINPSHFMINSTGLVKSHIGRGLLIPLGSIPRSLSILRSHALA